MTHGSMSVGTDDQHAWRNRLACDPRTASAQRSECYKERPDPSLPCDPSLPLICFLALVLYRVMCMRLKASGSSVSPRTALELLRRIQKHSATIGERAYTGISKTTPEQLDLFAAMSLPKP